MSRYTQVAREVAPNPETGQLGRKRFSPEKIEEVEQASGAMPIAEVLLHKIRYFSDGVVLSSAEFVNRAFERERHRFGPKRKDGARKMRGVQRFGPLRVLRVLRSLACHLSAPMSQFPPHKLQDSVLGGWLSLSSASSPKQLLV